MWLTLNVYTYFHMTLNRMHFCLFKFGIYIYSVTALTSWADCWYALWILVRLLRQIWLEMLIWHDSSHAWCHCSWAEPVLWFAGGLAGLCQRLCGAQWAFMENKHATTGHVWQETNEMFSCLHFLLVSPSCPFSETLSGSDSTACTLQSIMAVSETLYGNLPSRICIMLEESSPLPQRQRHISILNRC